MNTTLSLIYKLAKHRYSTLTGFIISFTILFIRCVEFSPARSSQVWPQTRRLGKWTVIITSALPNSAGKHINSSLFDQQNCNCETECVLAEGIVYTTGQQLCAFQ
ncbi:hypothetical protein ATANTOWER_024349 [Ataeniobius toweri]|uniref:Uncharacterized protein n=1 Tax=Ataeniobius toweri TaxID=208326 RepID=A0ABU7A2U7_9TELE|nr:hypothetical protein [Ataeniobius toweri]